MSTKSWVTLLVIIGSIIGGYIPTLFGVSILSLWGLIASAIGGIIGIWIGLKLGD
jgi:hypothetical protein